jgi:uncharacterized membrane protein YfcA
VATSEHRFVKAWLQWFSSVPHLCAASAALVVVGLALLGAMETWLRVRFGAWWWVAVVAAYWGVWLLTSIGIKVLGKERRSWKDIFYPEPDRATKKWLERGLSDQQRWILLMVSTVVLIVGVGSLLVTWLGAERVNAVAGIISVLLALAGALGLRSASGKPPGGEVGPAPAAGDAQAKPASSAGKQDGGTRSGG